MAGLNAHQARAVSAEGHCVVLACPGSGKTRVLAVRAAHLLSRHPEGRLCAVTFTRDAAMELKERILDQAGRVNARRIAVGTFHSIAYAQLRRADRRAAGLRVLSESERLALIRRCREVCGARIALESLIRLIDAAKASMEPADLPPPADAVHAHYQEALERDGAMDFYDIMLQAVRRMRDGALRPLPVRWLLVDEAQDMDEVQMHWVLEHASHGIEVTLVGDDDQSLYGFRHALGHAGLRHVEKTLSAAVIHLPLNYRCARNILGHAGILISHNTARAAKEIRPHRSDDGLIEAVSHASRWAEARAMARAALTADGSFAALARTNAILDYAEAALALQNVDSERLGGGRLWDGPVGALFLGLLRSIAHGDCVGAANTLHACGVDAKPLLALDGKNFLDGLSAVVEASPETVRPIVQSLQRAWPRWRDQSGRGRAGLVVHAAAAWLSQYLPPSHLETLGLLEKCLAGMRGSLAQRISLVSRESRPRRRARVALMTLHASKGLEFDNVWILGCEDGSLPHAEGDIEEERRLMYVGITRAKHRLWLSFCTDVGSPSRFLREAGIPHR